MSCFVGGVVEVTDLRGESGHSRQVFTDAGHCRSIRNRSVEWIGFAFTAFNGRTWAEPGRDPRSSSDRPRQESRSPPGGHGAGIATRERSIHRFRPHSADQRLAGGLPRRLAWPRRRRHTSRGVPRIRYFIRSCSNTSRRSVYRRRRFAMVRACRASLSGSSAIF